MVISELTLLHMPGRKNGNQSPTERWYGGPVCVCVCVWGGGGGGILLYFYPSSFVSIFFLNIKEDSGGQSPIQ